MEISAVKTQVTVFQGLDPSHAKICGYYEVTEQVYSLNMSIFM
jgi:hypothetical protein